MPKSTAHLFALWYKPLSQELPVEKSEFIIKDDELVNRMITVLRMQAGEQCVLFDRHINALITLVGINKKSITVRGETMQKNTVYNPSITALVPLLKKDDLAMAIVQLVACGVSAIQLVMTEGVQRSWGGLTEYARLERLIIASAEQSKQFAIPDLYEPLPLVKAVKRYPYILYGDPAGIPFKKVFYALPTIVPACAVLVGPEADFTLQEKELLQTKKAIGCALTPTVLKSHLALTILAGAVRSWYYAKE